MHMATHWSLVAIPEGLKGTGLSQGCIYQYASKRMSGSSNIQRGWKLNVIKVTVSADRTGYNLYSLSKPPHPYKPIWIINKEPKVL